MTLIIDCHGHYTTAPAPHDAWRDAQKAAFKDAATRWSQIVVGDVPDVTDGNIIIDDIRITATAPSIDGRGGVLGQAAPTGFRSGSSLPLASVSFDASLASRTPLRFWSR